MSKPDKTVSPKLPQSPLAPPAAGAPPVPVIPESGIDTLKPEEQERPDKKRQDPLIPRKAEEIGGPSGLEPTRYGDWERNGRCIDF
jgi:hypothetical protein